ncbi:MAG: type II secretion system protein GspG [Deltaproteobacteria bacterium]|nr:type II secretion system protein GspG [Deltaproteobacteria bacterium]
MLILAHALAVTTITFVLLAAAGILFQGAATRFLPRYECGGGIEQARTDAQSVRGAVEMYLAQNPSAACPTVSQLVSERILSARTRTIDPWENAFEITCSGEDVQVVSAGPDGRMDTEDDVQ